MLGRIACNSVNTSDNIGGKLQDFFVEKLNFHKVLDTSKALLTYDEIQKKMYMSDEDGILSDEDDEGWDTESDLDE